MIHVLLAVLTGMYVVAAVGLAIFSCSLFVLLGLWAWHRRRAMLLPSIDEAALPEVLVQLPIYNEADVVERLLAAVAALDYPADRLMIQVLDDSDDETAERVAACVRQQRQRGISMVHVRRSERTGYKAGALAHGLVLSSAPFIAIFDADFVPQPDFLRRTVPHFMTDERVGIVQARWAHLNAGQNLMTRSQAMSIDGHFVIEQTARSRGGLLVSFNGTGGLWRRACLEAAGGWSHATVSEDLDLSYRVQMCGWRLLYLPDVTVPAELPPQVAAYKRQQFRWAKGTTQNLLRHLPALWRSPRLTLVQKGMGTLHLAQYLPQPLIVLLTLLTPILMVYGLLQTLPLAPLGVTGLAAPLMYVLSQQALYRDWPRRLLAFPVLLAIGSGVSINNTVGVIEALLRRPSVFKRTPKFARANWKHSRYALRPEWTLFLEMGMVVYTAVGGLAALRLMPGIAPFLFAQTYGFGAVVVWSVMEWWQIRRASDDAAPAVLPPEHLQAEHERSVSPSNRR